MKDWIIKSQTQSNCYEIYVDSSKTEPFGILRNNKPLPKRYRTIWDTIQAMEDFARHETIVKFYTSTVYPPEDVCPQYHGYFIKHYSTGKYKF